LKEKQQVYIVCGEASGDLHAANLVAAWKKINPSVEFRAWGGDRLMAQGVQLDQHIQTMSFMGFWEVFKNLPRIAKQFKKLKSRLKQYRPDLLVLVDYPGFNLRMAKWAHSQNIKVLYYISPTVWAWKKSRAFQIEKHVEKLYCILPFEPEFYAKLGIEVAYFGHPLIDEIQHFKLGQNESLLPEFNKPVLALLPGSRMQELAHQLPLMLDAASCLETTHQIVVACAPHIQLSVYKKYCEGKEVYLSTSHTYNLLSVAKFALVTSGTATLETALFGVPQVVCYKSSSLSIWLAKKLVSIKYISLVNLILDELAVPELIQGACTAQSMGEHLASLQEGSVERAQQLEHYKRLDTLLQAPGTSARIADSMNRYL